MIFNDIKSLKIILPPLNLQNQFEQKVKSKLAATEKLKAHLTELETLYQTLMAETFG